MGANWSPNVGWLTHWGRVTHICVSRLTIIGSDNGLATGWPQAIIRTNAGILLNGPLGTNFSEMLIEIHVFSFKKMHLKMSSCKWRPFCLGHKLLITLWLNTTKYDNTGAACIFLGACSWAQCLYSLNGRTSSWWRHQMETFSASLALCTGKSSVTGEFPLQRPVTRSFDVFFNLRLE